MILFIFMFCLPALLGYALFVGLAKQMSPFTKPYYPEKRPAWLLGIWTGLSSALVLMLALHLIYGMSPEEAKTLFQPSILLMAALLTPGFLGYVLYRHHVGGERNRTPYSHTRRRRSKTRRPIYSKPRYSEQVRPRDATKLQTNNKTFIQPSIKNKQADFKNLPQTDAPIIATFLDSGELHVLDTHTRAAANSDSLHDDSAIPTASVPSSEATSEETAFEEFHYSVLELDTNGVAELTLSEEIMEVPDLHAYYSSGNTSQLSCSLPAFSPSPKESKQAADTPLDSIESVATNTLIEDHTADSTKPLSTHFMSATPSEKTHSNGTTTAQPSANPVSFLKGVELSEKQIDSAANTRGFELPSQIVNTLKKHLAIEKIAHEKTARQLRITRRVLTRLASNANNKPTKNSDVDEPSTQEDAQQEALLTPHSLEHGHTPDTNQTLKHSDSLASLRQELIASKQEIRRCTAARAKALSTANKAIAFARQTLQVRALIEEELDKTQDTLAQQQSTISSLIKELEQEKERSQEEVLLMVKKLTLYEQQLVEQSGAEEPSQDSDHSSKPRSIAEEQSLSSDT